MEQRHLKLLFVMESKPLGSHPSSSPSGPYRNMLFTDRVKGVSAESVGVGGEGGCSASKAIALLPMILSGLGALTPIGLVMTGEPSETDLTVG